MINARGGITDKFNKSNAYPLSGERPDRGQRDRKPGDRHDDGRTRKWPEDTNAVPMIIERIKQQMTEPRSDTKAQYAPVINSVPNIAAPKHARTYQQTHDKIDKHAMAYIVAGMPPIWQGNVGDVRQSHKDAKLYDTSRLGDGRREAQHAAGNPGEYMANLRHRFINLRLRCAWLNPLLSLSARTHLPHQPLTDSRSGHRDSLCDSSCMLSSDPGLAQLQGPM